MISIIIPSHNNLKHLKNAYNSIKKHAPDIEIVLLDDASTDDTWGWMLKTASLDRNVIIYKSPTRDGHTVLYDLGIQLATNNIVGIMHADMIMGPNYIENMVKHLKPMTVVCGTRIEPPLHPPGPEKIIENFGLDFDSLNVLGFELYCEELQNEFKDQTSNGMFAPWILYKEDFTSIGGHDWGFAPFPYEDSDIFQRWLLNGYKLIQSRDAFVYHLTCRGHRWNEKIGVNDDYFTVAEENARRYYIKKWGSWIRNDEYSHPVLIPVFNKCAVIKNYQSSPLDDWFKEINPSDPSKFDVVVEFDLNQPNDYSIISQINEIVANTADTGVFEISNFKITINSFTDRSKDLIFINNDTSK